jgi:hypothetical protein
MSREIVEEKPAFFSTLKKSMQKFPSMELLMRLSVYNFPTLRYRNCSEIQKEESHAGKR